HRPGLDTDSAADVFQEVFLIIHRQLYSLRSHASLAAWIITITGRECQRLSRHSLAEEELSDEALGDDTTLVEEQAYRWEMQQAIERALAELEPRCRALLSALFLEVPAPTYAELSQ